MNIRNYIRDLLIFFFLFFLFCFMISSFSSASPPLCYFFFNKREKRRKLDERERERKSVYQVQHTWTIQICEQMINTLVHSFTHNFVLFLSSFYFFLLLSLFFLFLPSSLSLLSLFFFLPSKKR